ncbi:hypothetical protein LguiA_029783 [Lonicera macranthoides]
MSEWLMKAWETPTNPAGSAEPPSTTLNPYQLHLMLWIKRRNMVFSRAWCNDERVAKSQPFYTR